MTGAGNLDADGGGLPPAVARVAAFLSEREVWHQLGRNPEVHSCRDAAHKRSRLGETGIPLWDELKSFFGVVRRADGHPQHIVVHCRGDHLVDLDRVAGAVRSPSPPERLDGGALEHLGMAYGLVNPFEPWSFDGQLLAAAVLQVFDRDLIEPVGIPGTVMTNAGSLTWSVELHAHELVKALDHVVVADVSYEDPDEGKRPAWTTTPTTFGLITGNGPDSGMLLWRAINRVVRAELGDARRDLSGDFAMPRVLVHSLPELGLTMELDRRHEAVWPALRAATAELCRDGATVVAVACNTTPYFAPELQRICDEYGARFVSMPEVAGEWLRRQGIKEIALLGVQTVADLGPWSPYREPLSGVQVEIPGKETMRRIHELAYRVKSEGPSHRSLTRLRQLLSSEVRTETVLLALTELSLLMEIQKRPSKSGRLIVDTIQLYAEALAQNYLQRPLTQTLVELPQIRAER
jgi:aspartate racemase